MTRPALALLVVCITALVAAPSAHAGTITGKVTDGASGAPIQGIEVQVYDRSKDPSPMVASMCTPPDGIYVLSGFATGAYTVKYASVYLPHCDSGLVYGQEFYDDKPNLNTSNTVSVTTDSTAFNIDAVLQGGGQIRGTVTDATTGAVVKGTEVEVYDAAGTRVTWQCTTTGGTYAIGGLATGTYRVVFASLEDKCGTKLNYTPQSYNGKTSLATANPVSVSAGASTGNVNAALYASIVGTVTNATTGAAVANVEVEAYDSSNSMVASNCSRADGTYRIQGLAPGTYRVGYTDESCVSQKQNYMPQFYSGKSSLANANAVAVAAGATTTNINLSLAVGGQITGKVTDGASGSAVSGVRVDLYDSSGTFVDFTRSISDGTYALQRLATGSYKVDFVPGPGQNNLPQFYNAKATLATANPVFVTLGVNATGINATLAAAGQMSGTITDATTGAGVPGEVDVYDFSGQFAGAACSQANGTYTVAGLTTGTYYVKVMTDRSGFYGGICGVSAKYVSQFYAGKASLAFANPVSVTAGVTTAGINAALQLASGKISGKVTAAAGGSSLAGIEVEVYDEDDDFLGSVCTAADGTYRYDGLAAGSYRVNFKAGGGLAFCPPAGNYEAQFFSGKSSIATANPVSVGAGATTANINAALQPGGQVKGKVTNASTQAAIQNAEVTIYDSTNTWVDAACTAADGTYTIPRLKPGTYKVGFTTVGSFFCGAAGNFGPQFYSGQGSLTTANAVTVTAGATILNINAALQPTPGKITGKVTDAITVAPLKGIEVEVYDANDSFLGSQCTAADGTYTFPSLAAATYRVNFKASGGYCLRAGNYLAQFYTGKATLATANPVSVAAGATTPNVNAAMEPGGQITGTLTDGATHAAIQNGEVDVYDSTNTWVDAECTAADGTYALARLKTGTYHVGFTTVGSFFCGAAGNYLSQFSNGKSSLATADPLSVIAGTTIQHIDAALTPSTKKALTVTRAGAGSGTVTSSPSGINCSGTCSADFPTGTTVTLTSTATAGSAFAGWSGGGCSGAGTCVVTMSSARSVTATFAPVDPAGPASSDFNGDGFSDLAVGVPGENVGSVVDAGLVNVIYGSGTGLVAASGQGWTQSSPGVAGNVNGGERFGAAVASGDFNGDGFDDLAVGAPGDAAGSTANAGSVTVLLGSAGGLTGTGSKLYTQDSVGIEETAASGDGFGSALAAGALGGSAADDLAIGAPGDVGGAGVVHVLFGSASGVSQSGDLIFQQSNAGGISEGGDHFGAALAIGDLGQSAANELAIGAPGEDTGPATDSGAVSVLPSALTQAGSKTFTQSTTGVPGTDVTGDALGSALAIGDLAGSATGDLAVGAPGEDIGGFGDAGQVLVLPGSASGVTTTGSHVRDEDTSGVPDSAEAGDRFGAALVAADVAGDGKADLAIGAPGESVGADAGAGQVTVLLGSTGNLSTTGGSLHNQDRPSVADTAEPGDHFGASLASGQWGNGAKADLAFGIPEEDVSSVVDAGALATLYGAVTLGPAGNQYIHQATVGIPDSSETGDGFAAGLGQG